MADNRGKLMLDTLFWYTGLVAWIFIVFGWAAMLYCTARDKVVLKRARAAACRNSKKRMILGT